MTGRAEHCQQASFCGCGQEDCPAKPRNRAAALTWYACRRNHDAIRLGRSRDRLAAEQRAEALGARNRLMAMARRLAATAAVLVVAACAPPPPPVLVPEVEPITEPRVCAAIAVYTLATGDDWGQRAVIANAMLNQYAFGGPDCRRPLDAALSDGFSPTRWQLALDAVDAVATGSYSLPPSCVRANRVVLTPDDPGPAMYCSMGGLSFVEVRP